MDIKVDTYDNRIEVTIAIPDGTETVEGGGRVEWDNVWVETSGEDGQPIKQSPCRENFRAVWTFVPTTDTKSAVTECVRLLVCSLPGKDVEPIAEQPVKSETVTVDLDL